LDQALAAAKEKEPYERRVREAMVSMEAIDLWHVGQLVEKEDHLVRADLNGEYSYPRAQALVEHCREASPREWGSGKAYRLSFLALHGGPLVTLTRGQVQVKVAPVLNGRIWQIVFNGKELLRVGTAGEKGYPFVAGSCDRLNPGPRSSEIVGEPTQSKVASEGGCGIKHWGSNPTQFMRKTVELHQNGCIRITGVSRSANRRKQEAVVSEVTEYAVGKGAEGVAAEVQTADGQWTALSFAAPPADPAQKGAQPHPEAAVPANAKALRIHIPVKGCVIEDQYLAPAVAGGKLVLDAKRGVLTVSIRMAKVEVPAQGDGQWLLREIHLRAHAGE